MLGQKGMVSYYFFFFNFLKFSFPTTKWIQECVWNIRPGKKQPKPFDDTLLG